MPAAEVGDLSQARSGEATPTPVREPSEHGEEQPHRPPAAKHQRHDDNRRDQHHRVSPWPGTRSCADEHIPDFPRCAAEGVAHNASRLRA